MGNPTVVVVEAVDRVRRQNKHPSVTDPVKPDPVDFSPSPSENLASRYLVKVLTLPGQFVASPVRLLHTQHISFVYV